ncbi:MAG: O-antigen ligase family protein, partial [Myxococcota bacterium]
MKDRVLLTFFLLGSAVLLLGPDSRRLLRVSASIVLAWAIPVCFVEVVVPNLFSTATGRSAGLYLNPNIASAAILVCLICAVDLARPTAKSLILIALGVAAVFATFSRMGMVFATFLFIGFALTPRFADRRAITAGRRIVLLATLVVLGAIAVAWVAWNIELSDDARLRIRSFLTGDLSDASASGRIERAFETAAVAQKDLLGHGPGTVERMGLGPHNTYLYIAVDYGIPGVLLFLGILGFGFARALRAGFRRAAGAMAVVALMAFTSFFSHHVDNNVDLAVGFAALMTGALIDPEKRAVRAPPAAIPQQS